MGIEKDQMVERVWAAERTFFFHSLEESQTMETNIFDSDFTMQLAITKILHWSLALSVFSSFFLFCDIHLQLHCVLLVLKTKYCF